MPKGVAGRKQLTEPEQGGCEFISVSGLCRERGTPALTQPGLITNSLSRKKKGSFHTGRSSPRPRSTPWCGVRARLQPPLAPSASCLWAGTSCVKVCRGPDVCLAQKRDSRGLGCKIVMLLCCVDHAEVWPGYL